MDTKAMIKGKMLDRVVNNLGFEHPNTIWFARALELYDDLPTLRILMVEALNNVED